MHAIALHQPRGSLIAWGSRPWRLGPGRFRPGWWVRPSPFRPASGWSFNPAEAIEQELQTRLGEDWRRTMPAGTVLVTAMLASMARVKHANLRAGYAVHDHCTEIGCFVGTGQTPIDPWGDLSPDRWLWFLTDVEVLREPVPAVGHQSFWQWYVDDCRR